MVLAGLSTGCKAGLKSTDIPPPAASIGKGLDVFLPFPLRDEAGGR